MAEVLDDLLGPPVTPGVVDVLEGRQCTPSGPLGEPRHPLESPAAKPNFFSLLWLNRRCCAFFTTLSEWVDKFRFSVVYAAELKAFHLLHCGLYNVVGDVLSLLFPEVHDQYLRFVDVEGEVVFLAPLRQGPYLVPVGCLVIVGNQAYRCCVVCRLDE